MTRTKRSPTSPSCKSNGAGLQADTPKRSGSSVALAGVEFSASEIGAAVLADPLLVDCYRALREEGGAASMVDFVLWQAKLGLERSFADATALLEWDGKAQAFRPAPGLVAYRARRCNADTDPVVPREGWDEAFAALIVDVVKERVRKAERCPAAGA